MISIVLAGRNDDYGGDFRERLFRTTLHNASLLTDAGVEYEYLLAEWNPLPDRASLSEEFVQRVPNARAVVIPSAFHEIYSLNPNMPFHEMVAKNAALCRARGDQVIVTNADIILGGELVERIAAEIWRTDTLYRAHRIDVKPELSWEEMQDPANQLSSGEGVLPPCYYLGAGGDFCLASREVWHFLRGFNERIRFSTRAKDWQFFLSAAALGIKIEFIGNCYHLDHGGGFRNTASEDLSSGMVHFGRQWDIEFGLPLSNPEEWGLGGVAERPYKDDKRIMLLEAANYAITEPRDFWDREMRTMLTHSAADSDCASAIIYHAICAAHRQGRRLICRVHDVRTAVALSGLQAVASLFGVKVSCDWSWPNMPGFTMRQFEAPPQILAADDWVLEEVGQILELKTPKSAEVQDISPTKWMILKPEFDPLLVRRLCRACLRMQESGIRRIAIYGAGHHTEKLLNWGLPDSISLAAIVTTRGESTTKWGLPVVALRDFAALDVDALLLSSCSFEQEMAQEAERCGISPVIPLYSDWPKDVWRIPERNCALPGLRSMP